MASPGVAATWSPEDFAGFVLDHLAVESIVLRMGATRININGESAHVPRLNSDGTATWTAEGAEITSNAPDGDEILLVPKKLANVLTVSNEAVADNDVSVLDNVGTAMTRSLAVALDTAVFDAVVASATRPAGLRSTAYTIPGAAAATLTAAADLDLLTDAATAILNVGGNPTAAFMAASDVGALAKLKAGTGLNTPLLTTENDATGRPQRRWAGLTLVPTPGMPAGTALVADTSQIVVGVRKQASVEFSSHAKFTADSVAVRVTGRFDWDINDVDGLYLLT